MATTLLPDKERQKPLAWLLVGVALVLVYLVVLDPVVARHIELGQRAEALQRTAGSARARLAEAPAIRQRLEQMREQQEQSNLFLESAQANLASVELSTRLKNAIAQHTDESRCQLLNSQNLNRPTESPFVKVAIQVRMRCDLSDLYLILHELESGQPYVFVENLRLSEKTTRRRQGRQYVNHREMDARFNVAGYLKPGTES